MRNYNIISIALFTIILTLGLVSAINVDFVNPTPNDGATIASRNFIVNATIDSATPISSIVYNWNNTNYTIYDDSLVLYYNFDNRSALGENATHVKDISKYGNNGTISGASLTTGKFDNAYSFDGINDYINTSTSILPTSEINFTISAWANYAGAGRYIIAQINQTANGGIAIYRGTDDSLQLFVDTSTCYATGANHISTQIGTGNWFNILATYNGTGYSLYVNGNRLGGCSGSYPSFITGDRFFVGNRFALDRTWNGSIDEVKVWKKELTSNEITNEYLGYRHITKLNNTQFNYNKSEGNITGISNNYYSLFINDTSNNIDFNQQSIRFLNNINLTTTSLGNIRSYFYGTNTHGVWGSNLSWIDTDSNGILDSLSNYQWHRSRLLDSRINYIRVDMNLDKVSINETTFNITANASNTRNSLTIKDTIKFAYDNNLKVLLIANYMPNWLANKTSGYCSLDDTNSSCIPSNYTSWGNTVVNYLDFVDCDVYNVCEVEVWNEPDISSFWLNNLTSSYTDFQTRATQYVLLYNATYDAIKASYPNMAVGGLAITSGNNQSVNSIFYNTFYGNLTSKMDFSSYHRYRYAGALTNFDSQMLTRLNDLFGNCTSLGGNCSRIVISEWSEANSTIQNNTDYNNVYELQSALAYIGILNNYANITSLIQYQWSEAYKYSNSANYPEYPQLWSMVSEPQLDNKLYAPFSVTSNFTRLAPASATVYQSTSDYGNAKSVYTRTTGGYDSIIVTNTENDYQNISIKATGFTGTLIDTSTGILYDFSSGTADKTIVLEPYEVVYLTEPNMTLVEGTGLVSANYLGENLATTNDVWISYSDGTLRRIASNFTNTTNINLQMTLSRGCAHLIGVTLTPKNAAPQSVSYSCSNGILYIQDATINPSSTSNLLYFNYSISETVVTSCDNVVSGLAAGSNMLTILIATILGVLVISFIVYGVGRKYNFDPDKMVLSIGGVIIVGIIIIFGLLVLSQICTVI